MSSGIWIGVFNEKQARLLYRLVDMRNDIPGLDTPDKLSLAAISRGKIIEVPGELSDALKAVHAERLHAMPMESVAVEQAE